MREPSDFDALHSKEENLITNASVERAGNFKLFLKERKLQEKFPDEKLDIAEALYFFHGEPTVIKWDKNQLGKEISNYVLELWAEFNDVPTKSCEP